MHQPYRRFITRSSGLANPKTTVRVEKRDDASSMIKGYGAVYYDANNPATEYWLWDDLVERIKPGAFDRVISESQDVRCLFNHDSNYVLGRTASGTCRLASDQVGLYYEADSSADPQWQSVASKITRGDVTGSSFSFYPSKVLWESIKTADRSYDVRWITEMLVVFDVGPVTFPAYAATTSSRNVDTHERARLLSERNALIAERDSGHVAMRSRIAQLHQH